MAPVRGALSILRPALAAALRLALIVAPSVVADDRDPRCPDWEEHGAPPGVDMAVMCPGGLALGDVPLGDEPLVPYVVGLIVMACVLGVVGLVATRVLAKPARPVRAADLWPGQSSLPVCCWPR